MLHRNYCLIAIACLLVTTSYGINTATLPKCTNPLYRYVGYTHYHGQDGYRTWSHCKFFRPQDPGSGLCGSSKTWQDVFLCDPDSLLLSPSSNNSVADQVGDNFQDFVNTLQKNCPKRKIGVTPTESVVVGLVLVEAIVVPDINTTDLCQNDCGEIYPIHDDFTLATHEEHETAANNFIQQIINREWVIGQCFNQIMLLYVAQQNKLWTYYGAGAIEQYGTALLEEMATTVRGMVEDRANTTELAQAMLQSSEVINSKLRIEKTMDFSSPAVTMLLMFLGSLLLLELLTVTAFCFTVIKQDID